MNYPMPPVQGRSRSSVTDALISAVLGGLLLIGPDVVSAILSVVVGTGFADAHDPKRWIFFAVYVTANVLTLAMLSIRGRTPARRIGAAAIFLVFIGLADLRWAAYIAGLTALSLQDQPVWIYVTYASGTFMLAWILGWSIARRQTGLAWIGLIPALLLIGGWIALTANSLIRLDVGPGWLSELLSNLLFDLVVVLGIACLWIFDVVGLSMRRPAAPAQVYGAAPQYPVVQPVPYSGPGYPQYQQAPHQPPPGPMYPPQGYPPTGPVNRGPGYPR